VLLAVSVRDPEGRPARGLTQDDFIIAEDRTRQKIESFSVASVPVNVVLLLDASGSVFSELASIRKAAGKFVDALGPEDQISVIQFADKVELLQDWTKNHDDVRQALNWRFKGGQVTKFWDAVYLAAEDQLSKVEGRRAIILLTDGVDTASKLDEGQARAALDRSGATVFVVSKAEVQIQQIQPYAGKGGTVIGTAPQARQALNILEAAQEKLRGMADRYGGRMWAPLNDADLTSAYADVAAELKQQYVITYVPQNETHDGRWRSVDVFLTRPGLVARTRKGYIAQ
jgi:Ca-activated chloride channel family protein